MSRPIPILFIHGYNGSGASWHAFREALIARGAEPSLLRLFHYGWREAGAPVVVTGTDTPPPGKVYDNRGDIRAIASRLAYRESAEPEALDSQVRRLSEASVALGGSARVTLVAHSMGGIIARYYLSRRESDEWGTLNEGLVEQLITIGTPHLGVDLARVTRLVPPDAFIWKVLRALERLPFFQGHPSEELAQLDAQIQRLQYTVQSQEMPVMAQTLDSPALSQMIPGSPFLQALSAPGAFPSDVRLALIWGEIHLTGGVRWGPVPLWERTLSLGDLLIPAISASTMPNVAAQRFPQRWEQRYMVQLGDPAAAPYALTDLLPPVAHSPLLLNESVQRTVVQLIGL